MIIISSAEVLQKLNQVQQPFIGIFQSGSLEVEIYKPAEVDLQQPHDKDEVYIVISGHGEFVSGTRRNSFVPGDFIFVPAGEDHRFENFSDDFCTWVIFYGPKGGEGSTK